MYCRSLKTPIGRLQLFADDRFLHRIAFPSSPGSLTAASPAPRDHLLLNTVSSQLIEYFAGSRHAFDLPLSLQGTAFQRAVWEMMQQIPYGMTRTYGKLAAELGNSNKARAVGGAANKNPLPLVIPCHRVMGGAGKLTGFAGGLESKQFLLELEMKKL